MTDTIFCGLFKEICKVAPERLNSLDFNEAGHDGVAVALGEPYANHLHLAPCQHFVTRSLASRTLFLVPNHQCQSTEGRY